MTEATASTEFIICGITLTGSNFRPSDWAERLCGVLSIFGGDRHRGYSPYVHPVISGGVKCVVVDVRLRDIEPMAYTFALNFAKDNELQVRPGRKYERAEEATPPGMSAGNG